LHIRCAFCALLRYALLRESNSVYFDGGVHTCAALVKHKNRFTGAAQQRMCERPLSFFSIAPPQLQRMTQLRRRAPANAGAASYWLRRVPDDDGAETGRVHREGVPEAEPAMHPGPPSPSSTISAIIFKCRGPTTRLACCPPPTTTRWTRSPPTVLQYAE